jgi:WD40 repeat protein
LNTKNIVNKFAPDTKKKLGMCMKVEIIEWEGHVIIVAIYESGDLRVWDVRTTAQPLLCLDNLHTDVALTFACNRTLTRGVSGGADDVLCFWNMDLTRGIGTIETRVPLPHRGINDLCLRHDERILASAGWDHRYEQYPSQTTSSLRHILTLNSLTIAHIHSVSLATFFLTSLSLCEIQRSCLSLGET